MITLASLQVRTHISKRFLSILVIILLASSAALAQTASIAPTPSPLTEANLNGATLTLTLGGGETFIDYTTLSTGNFDLQGAPTGTSIFGVTGTSATTATLTLAFNHTDFDANQDLSIDIHADVLTLTASGVLSSSNVTVQALVESATLTASPPLTEENLDGSMLTVTLVNDQFTGTINVASFYLVNPPAGLTIDGANQTATTLATVTLLYDGTDFDLDITGFAVGIYSAGLLVSGEDLITAPALTITATVEPPPQATLVAVPDLNEYSLDGREVSIALVNESFINPGALVAGNFTTENAPPGVSVDAISGTPTANNVVLILGYDLTDFDVNYDDFRISIDYNVLTESTTDLVSSPVTVTYGLEPVITNISIPNDTMHIGSQVQVTITVVNDEGNNFTLEDGADIGGYPLDPATRFNATTYHSSFTVNEGGTDYATAQNIPVNDVQLVNVDTINGIITSIPGNIYTSVISQGNDLLDAHRPAIQYFYTSTSGPQNVGDVITFSIGTSESGLSFADSSWVNHKFITDPSFSITPLPPPNDRIYRLRYTVEEGDDPADQGELAVSMVAVDEAGNGSTPPFTAIDVNEVSIDATTPVISSALITSPDDTVSVGETLTIVVEADETGYRNVDASTWINGVYVEPDHLTFTDLMDGSYLYSYTVQETDGAVARGELGIHIVLQDAAPFTNANDPWITLNPNNVVILTDKPSAFISGPPEICLGDSALITVNLTGTAPWTMDIFDGTTTAQYISNTSHYTFWVQPTVSTDYTVTRVLDQTGNENVGSGVASIMVHPLPDVQIENLQGVYNVQGLPVLLEYTPDGGTFTGRGISGPPWIFDPGVAGVSPEGSPHVIKYTYEDENGCANSDSNEVAVVNDSAFISFQKAMACFNDSTFIITGTNVYGTTGSFSVIPTLPSSIFEDLGNDTAVLRPVMYNWAGLHADQHLTIIYTYEGLTGEYIPLPKDLTIDYLDEAVILQPTVADSTICQNEPPILLDGNYDVGYTFRSPGAGVEQDSTGHYYFHPENVDPSVNLIIYEHIADSSRCRVSDTFALTVKHAPEAGFIVDEPCISMEGGVVQFYSRSYTGASIDWDWGFGDPGSGEVNNHSSQENPTHHYSDTGRYTVTLSVEEDEYCTSRVSKTININLRPEANFIWSSDCESEDPVILTGTEETYNSPDSVNVWTWNIDSAGVEIFSSNTSGPEITYAFSSDAIYTIGYLIETKANCKDSTERQITLSPTHYLAQEPYLEEFEQEDHEWVKIANGGSYSSWTYDTVRQGEFPGTAASGSLAWYTDLPALRTLENSWVVSPCFNFEDFERPMVSLYIKRSLNRNREGAALEYTTDQGASWHIVGGVDEGGMDWYNSDLSATPIGNQPGGHSTGWTGASGGSPDNHWYNAAHVLDELVGEPEVRFRIAYGSMGDSETGFNDGFAFDNFNIKQRSRLTVLEYFTNANDDNCEDADSLIMNLMNEVQADVIDIQYHALGSQADQFYLDNQVPANSRGATYGVAGVPYAVLDGGIYLDELGYQMRYDFNKMSGMDPNVDDIRLRSLMDPDFKLGITVLNYSPKLEFRVDVEALRDLDSRVRTLYGVVLERRVEDAQYAGSNGITVFRHAARRILPDAGGQPLEKSWYKGESISRNFPWSTPFISTQQGKITIAVFMQDDETKEILQAVTNPAYVTSIFEELAPSTQVLIYPNPARELVNILFEESPEKALLFTLYDLSGKLVITDVIEPWQQHFTKSLGNIEQGLYIVEIRSQESRRVIYRDKLLHN
jgi:hypothetical protein